MSSQTALIIFTLTMAAFLGASINEATWRWREWQETKRRVGIEPLPAIKVTPSPMPGTPVLPPLGSVWKGKMRGEEVIVEKVNEYVVGCTYYLTNRSASFVEPIDVFLRAYTFMAPNEGQSAMVKAHSGLLGELLTPPGLSIPSMEMTAEHLRALRLSFGLDDSVFPEQEPIDAQVAIDAAEEAFADPAKKGMI